MKRIIIRILGFYGIKASEKTLTFSHIFSFLQAKLRRFLLKSSKSEQINDLLGLPIYKREQIVWRKYILQYDNQGRECLNKNECPCGCVTSEVLLADSSCDKHCFPEMMNYYEWDMYKKKNKFKVNLETEKVINI